jgi:hypothetical protein
MRSPETEAETVEGQKPDVSRIKKAGVFTADLRK